MTSNGILQWVENKYGSDYRSIEKATEKFQEVSQKENNKQLDGFLFGSKKTKWRGYINDAPIRGGITLREKIEQNNQNYKQTTLNQIQQITNSSQAQQFKIDQTYDISRELQRELDKKIQEVSIPTGPILPTTTIPKEIPTENVLDVANRMVYAYQVKKLIKKSPEFTTQLQEIQNKKAYERLKESFTTEEIQKQPKPVLRAYNLTEDEINRIKT